MQDDHEDFFHARLEARQELRRQTGTLRFDLNTLAQTKAKDEKKKALELRKDFITKVS
jgi:photosystem II oxygen-evolving enhancer protein 3